MHARFEITSSPFWLVPLKATVPMGSGASRRCISAAVLGDLDLALVSMIRRHECYLLQRQLKRLTSCSIQNKLPPGRALRAMGLLSRTQEGKKLHVVK